jgi:hypothetical protein
MQNILNINAYIQIYNTHVYTYIQKMELLEVAAAAETDNLTQQLSTATERVDALQMETLALKVSLLISACHTFSFINIVHTCIQKHIKFQYDEFLPHTYLHTYIHTYIHSLTVKVSLSVIHYYMMKQSVVVTHSHSYTGGLFGFGGSESPYRQFGGSLI